MRRWLRLGFALQRWEVLFVAILTLSVSAAMFWVAWQADQVVAHDPACFASNAGAAQCGEPVNALGALGGFGGQLLTYALPLAFGAGLVMGVPLVAREIEHETTALAWSLTPSRRRWLLARLAFAGPLVIGLLAVLAVASDTVAAAILPDLDLAADFTWFGQRGILLVMSGLLGLGIGLGIGAMLGRQLPGLLAAGLATVALFVVVNMGLDRWLMTDATIANFALPNQGVSFIGSRSLGGFFQLQSGAVVTLADLEARGIQQLFWDEDRGEFYATEADLAAKRSIVGRHVDLLVPGDKYGTAVAKESVLLGVLAVVSGGLAFAVVDRRKPY
jgi:hypothetical protein